MRRERRVPLAGTSSRAAPAGWVEQVSPLRLPDLSGLVSHAKKTNFPPRLLFGTHLVQHDEAIHDLAVRQVVRPAVGMGDQPIDPLVR